MKRLYILIVLFLFSFIFCAVNEAAPYQDNFTFTRIDLTYSDASLNTTINDLNLSTIFYADEYTGTVVLSGAYTVPDGTITGLKIYANYTLAGGRGSGTADWTPSTRFPITVSGSKRITVSFYYYDDHDWYYISSAELE